MAHHPPDEITTGLDVGGHSRFVVVLADRDTAWNPTSTKHNLIGPARVTYRRHPDGGIDAAIR